MFVRDFIHVSRPFEVVAPRFVHATTWLSPIAIEAAVAAREVVRSLSTERFGAPRADPDEHADDDVRCEVGPIRARDHGILLPMWLINLGRSPALPDLNGDLEVAPVGSERSRIALDATYRRATDDRDEVRRVERATEAGVRTLLAGIASYLAGPSPAL